MMRDSEKVTNTHMHKGAIEINEIAVPRDASYIERDQTCFLKTHIFDH